METELTAPIPVQYELTYRNHIVAPEDWPGLGGIAKVFPDLAWRTNENRFLPAPTDMKWDCSFEMPGQQGRLHVSLKHGFRKQDKKRVLVLDLTARGMGSDDTRPAQEEWFAMAHEWVVRGFVDLTSEDAQRSYWGKLS